MYTEFARYSISFLCNCLASDIKVLLVTFANTLHSRFVVDVDNCQTELTFAKPVMAGLVLLHGVLSTLVFQQSLAL